MQAPHDLGVGCTEHALDLVDSECTARCVVFPVLDVQNVDVLVTLSLLWGQVEELRPVQAQVVRVEEVSKELQEFG